MTITHDFERQYPLVAEVTSTFADYVEAAAVTEDAISLPPNSTITGGSLTVDTDFDDDAAETFTMEVGTDAGGGVADLLSAQSVDGDEGTRVAIVPTGDLYTADTEVTLTLNMSVGASTLIAGSVRLRIEYVVADRGNENLG